VDAFFDESFEDERSAIQSGSYDYDDGPSLGISASHGALRWDIERDEEAEERLKTALDGDWEMKPDTVFARDFLSRIAPAGDLLYPQSLPKLCERCGSLDIFSQDFEYTAHLSQLEVPETQQSCEFCTLVYKALCDNEQYLSDTRYDHEFEYRQMS
jgi:hypothetical protein